MARRYRSREESFTPAKLRLAAQRAEAQARELYDAAAAFRTVLDRLVCDGCEVSIWIPTERDGALDTAHAYVTHELWCPRV